MEFPHTQRKHTADDTNTNAAQITQMDPHILDLIRCDFECQAWKLKD